MDDLITVRDAASDLGTTYGVLIWLHRRGVLTMHKRIGIQSNLVNLEEARRALELKRPVGRPALARRAAEAE